LFDLCSAWLNCIGPRWCWVVIKAVGCRPMRFLFRHNRSVSWILITLQFKPEELSDLYSATNMSVCADANITGTFLHFWTHKVHYKLQQSTLQNFDDGGFLSGWSFVRVVFSPGLAFLVVFCPVVLCPVVFCPYTGRGCDSEGTAFRKGSWPCWIGNRR